MGYVPTYHVFPLQATDLGRVWCPCRIGPRWRTQGRTLPVPRRRSVRRTGRWGCVRRLVAPSDRSL